jgi:(E)-4-hydroxy-3-methylbut-2-enyl-diphosphate synthase
MASPLSLFSMKRRASRQITLGGISIGGEAPVVVQSMTNTPTQDVLATVRQIKRLTYAGCEIVRIAVPDIQSARALKEIKAKVSLPIIADIHFDYRLALAAIQNGADGLRLNPGKEKGKGGGFRSAGSGCSHKDWGQCRLLEQVYPQELRPSNA